MSQEIDFQEVQKISIFYTDLGKKSRKVLEALHWWIKTFPLAYPCQSKIAKKAGCSRQWANQVIKRATDAGIIQKLRRAYSTCRYFCADWLKITGFKSCVNKFIETSKSLYEELTIVWTRFLTTVSSNSSNLQESKILGNKTRSSERWDGKEFPHHIAAIPIDDQIKAKLSCFSEADIAIAKEGLIAKKAKGKKFSKKGIGDYCLVTCLRRSKERGEVVNWHPYYRWLKDCSSGKKA